ncbi:hypothetical protein M404DRAFT_126561, partial [Pisolithus tinctorius Marx 270]
CWSWRNGVFAADGTTVNLYVQLKSFADSYYNHKLNFSLNCQVVIMPHNLAIVDYALGNLGSVHNVYAFQGMWIFKDPIGVMPFKKPQGGNLTKHQNTYNQYVSKICVRVEHAFVALKGQFQSLRELHIKIGNKPGNMDLAMYWITCYFILHNMVVQFEERHCEE